jgi:sortase B
MHKRDVGVTAEDHIVLLSTCSASSTNGRDILIGKCGDEARGNPFAGVGDGKKQPSADGIVNDLTRLLWTLLLLLASALVSTRLLLATYRRRKRGKRERK